MTPGACQSQYIGTSNSIAGQLGRSAVPAAPHDVAHKCTPHTHPPPPDQSQAGGIEKTVSDNKVVVYSATYCPYCSQVGREAQGELSASSGVVGACGGSWAAVPPPPRASHSSVHCCAHSLATHTQPTHPHVQAKGLFQKLNVPATVIETDQVCGCCVWQTQQAHRSCLGPAGSRAPDDGAAAAAVVLHTHRVICQGGRRCFMPCARTPVVRSCRAHRPTLTWTGGWGPGDA
jgi:hypothetical protein